MGLAVFFQRVQHRGQQVRRVKPSAQALPRGAADVDKLLEVVGGRQREDFDALFADLLNGFSVVFAAETDQAIEVALALGFQDPLLVGVRRSKVFFETTMAPVALEIGRAVMYFTLVNH